MILISTDVLRQIRRDIAGNLRKRDLTDRRRQRSRAQCLHGCLSWCSFGRQNHSLLSLKRNEEVRPIIFNSLIWASAAINSSDNPSEKYASCGSPLSFSGGITGNGFLRDLRRL